MSSISEIDLRGRTLFVATPTYGGMCHTVFATGLAGLVGLCAQLGIRLQFHTVTDDSLIPRARNRAVDVFLRSGFDTMLFIDSDIGFDPKDVIGMLAFLLTDTSNPYPVLAASYPKKGIDWNTIQEAASKTSLEDLPSTGYRFCFNPVEGETLRFDPLRPVEVGETGTGFMMIPKRTLLRYQEYYPDRSYIPDPEQTTVGSDHRIHRFFHSDIDPVSGYYLGEDYLFCRDVRKAGGAIRILPWIRLTHAGEFHYTGSLSRAAFRETVL